MLRIVCLSFISFSMLGMLTQANAGLKIELDYQYDSLGFFDSQTRRDALEFAANFVNIYVDEMAELAPEGDERWDAIISKPDGSGTVLVSNIPVPEDTVIIYVAGRPLSGRLAQAIDLGPLGSGTPEFAELVATRGQEGAGTDPATDFSPVGATISFNNDLLEVPWHFGISPSTIGPSQFDFITVAMHEIIHALGFTSTTKSFRDQTDFQGNFIGSEAAFVGSFTNPDLELDPSESHWRSNTRSRWNGRGQESLLAPGIAPGQRQYPTILDRAALRDIGWEEATAGDANRDRIFDSNDLVRMFAGGKFESSQPASWSDGDFSGDALFNSEDLVLALASGTYVFAAEVVPEPNSLLLSLIGFVWILRGRRFVHRTR